MSGLIALGAALATRSGADDSGRFRISGFFLAAGTDSPVGGAALAFDAPGRSRVIARTESDGSFATERAFRSCDVDVLLPADSPPRPGVVLARLRVEDADLANVVFAHPWSGRVHGRVVTWKGEPVPGISVLAVVPAESPRLRPWSDLLSESARATQSASDGTFSLDGLPIDRALRLVATGHSGLFGCSAPGFPSPNGGGPIEVVVYRPGGLRVTAADHEGNALPNVEVTLVRTGAGIDHPQSRARHTGSEGESVEIPELQPGRYAVTARRSPIEFETVADVDVRPAETTNVTVRGRRAAHVISGSVSNPTGNLYPGSLHVRAVRVGDAGVAATGEIQASKRFSIAVPEPGTYALSVRDRFMDSGPIVEAEAGAEDVALLFLDAAVWLRLRVVHDDDGSPVVGGDVAIGRAGGSKIGVATTGRQGEVDKIRFTPGRFDIVAAAPGCAAQRHTIAVGPDDRGERSVEIRLRRDGRRIEGRVIGANGRPYAGGLVALVHAGTPLPSTGRRTRADGTFWLDVLPEGESAEIALLSTRDEPAPDDFIVARTIVRAGDAEALIVATTER